MKRTLILAVILTTVVGGMWVAASPAGTQPTQASGSRPNLVVITIDTMRGDHLGCYGYFRKTSPNIDALAKDALVFDNCYSPMAQTLPSHTSLFTGVYPREHGMFANTSQVKGGGMYQPSPILKTLATTLSKQGYMTAGFVSAEPVKKESGLGAGFTKWYEPDDKAVPAEWTNRRVFEWIDSDGAKQPFFLWVHYFDPHAPYEPFPPYDKAFKTDDDLAKYMHERQFGEEGKKQASGKSLSFIEMKTTKSADSINAYDGEVAYTDEHIGHLFDKLKSKGLWDNTVVVVTGDHGEALGQHDLRGHGNIWLEQLHVPMVMRIPGQAPRRVATPIVNVDTFSTLAGLVPQLPLADFKKQSTGVDVLAPDNDKQRPLYAQLPGSRTVMVQAVVQGDWRYIMHPNEGDRLFNLKDDPYETKNVADSNKEMVSKFSKEVKDIANAQNANGKKNEAGKIVKMSSERSKALQGLGYGENEPGDDEGGAGRGDGTGYVEKGGDGEEKSKGKKEKKK